MASAAAAGVGKGGWYHGWNIVSVCILSQIAANALPINAFSLFLHDWSAELHVSVSTLTLGIAACGLLCAFMSPVIGILTDRYAARTLLCTGLVGMTLFCLGISFVVQTWQYLALYAVVLPVSLVLATSIPANALVSRWFVRRLGLALGLTAFGLGMAGVVMPPIVAAVMPVLGWRAIWRIGAAVIALVILPLVLFVVRERPSERDGLHYLTADDGTAVVHHGHGGGAADAGALRWRDILSRRNFWILVIAYVPMLALYGGCGSNLAPIATSRGLSQQTAGILLSLYSLAQLAATLASGILSDRFGNRVPLAGLAFLTAIGGATLAFGHGVAAMMLGAMFAGVGGSFWPLLAASVAGEFKGQGFGRAFGALMFFLPAAVMSPFAVAKVQENTGSYVPALSVMVVLAVLGGLACLLFLRERRGGHAPAAEEVRVGDAAVPLL